MTWRVSETHEVAGYSFQWIKDEADAWFVAVWKDATPDTLSPETLRQCLTIYRVRPTGDSKADLRAVRDFCQRFVADIPFRVRAIRNKLPTLSALGLAAVDTDQER